MSSEYSEEKAKEILKMFESLNYLNEHITQSTLKEDDFVLSVGYQANLIEVEKEVNWSRKHEHTSIYNEFCGQLTYIVYSQPGLKGGEEIHLKMCFSYAVTLMESCLSEMLKSVTMRHEQFKRNAMSEVTELKNATVNLSDLFDKEPKELIDNEIIKYLSYILYHNLKKVKNVYKQILGKDISAIDGELFKKISDLTAVRHDIVHRNGKKATGELIEITPDVVDSCIQNISNFVDGVHYCINDAIEELDAKKTD